ncbi:uncharacterized protein [Nicotiana tomentosiformis]|uniref:uncharacterized protein n=1 Tax=Nicotiana tomentosiformis TaxID=4098 RepID=UPI00388C487D
MVNVFLQAQEADYFQNMMSAMGKPFAEAIKIREMVENGLKTDRIISQSALKATSQAIQNGSGGLANRKKREEGALMTSVQMGLLQLVPPNRKNPKSPSYRPGTRCAYHLGAEGHDTEDCWTLKRAVENLIEQKRVVLRDEEVPNVTNNPLPTHNNGPVIGMNCDDKEFYPALKAIIAIVDSEARPKAALKQARNEKKITLTPQVAETNTGAAPAKDAILYVPTDPRKEQLMLNTPKRFEQRKVTLNVPKLYVPKGTYVARGPIISPRLNELVVISRAPQSPMRDPTAVPWNYSKIVVTYKGKEIIGEVNEMNQPRKYHNPEEQKMLKLSKDKRFPPKKPVSSEEAEEFFRKMKTSKYTIIDQLRKTPSQVSLLSLFISSNEHQKVLLKTLNEAYVLVGTSVEQLERMAEQFFEVNRISFSSDDLPQEGATHKKALHLTVKCEGYYMKRVMLDGGSGVDICPLSTLQRMKIGTERIRPNNVLDMDTSYIFLLGRPWIHTAGAVPSTLHQMVKFEHENQEIVVHGEDEQSIYRDPSAPCLEAREASKHIVYQAFEIVIVDQCKEGAPFPQPCLSNGSVMVTTEMIKHGYKPEKGLGVYLQSIIEPVTSTANLKFFGVGFRATEADRKWADERKKNGWVLPQPIPHLTKSFIDPKYVEEEEE